MSGIVMGRQMPAFLSPLEFHCLLKFLQSFEFEIQVKISTQATLLQMSFQNTFGCEQMSSGPKVRNWTSQKELLPIFEFARKKQEKTNICKIL